MLLVMGILLVLVMLLAMDTNIFVIVMLRVTDIVHVLVMRHVMRKLADVTLLVML